MTDTAPAATLAITAPKLAEVTLDSPIVRAAGNIEKLSIRKPQAGELRGLSLVEVSQLNVDALTKLLPRLCIPQITEVEVRQMDLADLLQCGAEIGNFLLPNSMRSEAQG